MTTPSGKTTLERHIEVSLHQNLHVAPSACSSSADKPLYLGTLLSSTQKKIIAHLNVALGKGYFGHEFCAPEVASIPTYHGKEIQRIEVG